MFAKRRRHADQHRVALFQIIEVGTCAKLTTLHGVGHSTSTDVLDVRLATVERVDLCRVKVESNHAEPGLCEDERKWQTDVPLSHNANDRLFCFDPCQQIR